MTARYTGRLTRGTDPGTVAATLRDAWGYTIHITGTLDPAGGYVLSGEAGEMPEALRIPGLDEEVGCPRSE